ncbi:MAG: hypothetical protein AAF224_07850 [Pseudomonadota bacterium]
MCDETTERELDAYLEKKRTTRRDFTVGASAAVVIGAVRLRGGEI